jgi:hypothetical protein
MADTELDPTGYESDSVGLHRYAVLRHIEQVAADRSIWVPTRAESVIGVKVGTFTIRPTDYEFYVDRLSTKRYTVTPTRRYTSSCDRGLGRFTSITVYRNPQC